MTRDCADICNRFLSESQMRFQPPGLLDTKESKPPAPRGCNEPVGRGFKTRIVRFNLRISRFSVLSTWCLDAQLTGSGCRSDEEGEGAQPTYTARARMMFELRRLSQSGKQGLRRVETGETLRPSVSVTSTRPVSAQVLPSERQYRRPLDWLDVRW